MYFKGIAPRYHLPRDLKFQTAIYNMPFEIRGYSMPQMREVVCQITQTRLQGKSDQEIWRFWEPLWKERRNFEEMTLAVTYWSDRKNFGKAKLFYAQLLTWAQDLQCWSHSDGLSSLYARLLEDMGPPIDRVLLEWNRSDNLWLRRQSVVSLLYYTRERKQPPSARRVLNAVEPLLGDSEHYVQKGVGWTLREVYQVDEKLTMKFVEKHLHAIHSSAYSAAVEKMPLATKKRLRDERARHRAERWS